MARKSNNGSIDYTFADFSKGLYLLDTPRNITEQIKSLALVGGRNIWSEKGALVSQHGYLTTGSLPIQERISGVTRTSAGNNSFFITTLDGTVFLYTAYQGIKKYMTSFESAINPILTRRNKDLIINTEGSNYIFGAYYPEADYVEIVDGVQLSDFTEYYEFTVSDLYEEYFWNNKELCIDGEHNFTVVSVKKVNGDDFITVRMILNNPDHIPFPSPVSIGEKTLFPITLHYTPEDEELPERDILPTYMAVCNNRLFISDVSGDIFYSQVGVIDGFDESYGAGFFGGFYNDYSLLLSMEEFLEGTLICKENGIYFLTIGDTVDIKKISQVGQKYESDHVIVGEKVYAFDTNSGAIVNALSVNVFGGMVSGKPVVSSEYINAENSGINNTKRFLTYNAENEVFILYYGEQLNNGLVLTKEGSLFPRELDKNCYTFVGFNQGVVAVTTSNEFFQDFKKGSIVPNMTYVAEFEPIGLRDNRMIGCTIAEITELNGIEFNLTTINSGASFQKIVPSSDVNVDKELLPPLLYSEDDLKFPSYELESKWAEKKSNVTRVYAPMSGRSGVSIALEFPENTDFCLSAIRLPDFSQGE